MCDIIKIRRDLHKIPEVGMNLPETVLYITDFLNKLENVDIRVIEGQAIVAKTKHHAGKRFIAFRSDMDALPMEELNDVSYKSSHPGIMHACGHDAHMAILLCFAEYINSLESPPLGVIFIFQPGEEGNAGAKWMLEHNIFNGITPDNIFALHMFPHLNTGIIASKPGALFIGTEEFYLTLKGPGGHAGFPERSIDLLEIFTKIFGETREKAGKLANGEDFIFFFGKTVSNGRNNVFPSYLKCEGTIRAYNFSLMKSLEEILLNACEKHAKNHYSLSFSTPYPPLINDSDSVSIVKQAAEINNLFYSDMKPLKIGEDFSFFLQNHKGAMFLLGCSGNGIIGKELHSQTFDIDESSLDLGLRLYITIYDLCR